MRSAGAGALFFLYLLIWLERGPVLGGADDVAYGSPGYVLYKRGVLGLDVLGDYLSFDTKMYWYVPLYPS